MLNIYCDKKCNNLPAWFPLFTCTNMDTTKKKPSYGVLKAVWVRVEKNTITD